MGKGTIDPSRRDIDGWDQLREAIVMTAVEDMRDTLAGKKMPSSCSLGNLKRFFYSGWGAMLLGNVDGKWLYQRLLEEGRANVKGTGIRSGKTGAAEKEADAQAV